MKVSSLWIVLSTATFAVVAVQAQYKGPRDYFPKDFPPPKSDRQPAPKPPAPSAPGASVPSKPVPVAPQPVKFKDVPLHAQFYLLTDTNRLSAWTKVSLTMAKNEKNGARQAVLGDTLVRR